MYGVILAEEVWRETSGRVRRPWLISS